MSPLEPERREASRWWQWAAILSALALVVGGLVGVRWSSRSAVSPWAMPWSAVSC